MKVGRIVLVIMMIIVFADFLVRFGLMLKEEYRGRGVSKRMAFGPAKLNADPAPNNQPTPEDALSSVKVEFSPIKLIAPVVEIGRNKEKRRRSKRKPNTKGTTSATLAMMTLLAFAQLAPASAAPIRQGDTPNHAQQKQIDVACIAVALSVVMAALLIRAYMVSKTCIDTAQTGDEGKSSALSGEI